MGVSSRKQWFPPSPRFRPEVSPRFRPRRVPPTSCGAPALEAAKKQASGWSYLNSGWSKPDSAGAIVSRPGRRAGIAFWRQILDSCSVRALRERSPAVAADMAAQAAAAARGALQLDRVLCRRQCGLQRRARFRVRSQSVFLRADGRALLMQPAGWIGGGQIGYNWPGGHWWLGIEADIQAPGKDSPASFAAFPASARRFGSGKPWLARCAAGAAGRRAPRSIT